jgi:lipopolysaccharide/colanic/teichoic acid biosynthesis glycosyltransferase
MGPLLKASVATQERGRCAQRALKRVLDVVVAALGLLATAPLQALAAFGIVLEDGPPVLFTQERAGQHGRRFVVRKLRSMRREPDPAEEITEVALDDPRVTRVGRWVRRLKLDELPQLVNVLRGEMSLVGPRPTIPEQVDAYDEFERLRLSVPPGLTGWAQVNGNVQLSWQERIALDVWYIRHWSLALDLKILAKTLVVVATGEKRNLDVVRECLKDANDSRRRGGLEPYRAAHPDR